VATFVIQRISRVLWESLRLDKGKNFNLNFGCVSQN
jgi:hypothetical protein